ILFAINDSEDFDKPGNGTHWSVLVYDRAKNAFLHQDSFRGINRAAAVKLYRAVKGFVKPARDDASYWIYGKKKCFRDEPRFCEGRTPQQTNLYDCGLYVLAIAEAMCSYWCEWMEEGEDVNWGYVLYHEVDEEEVETTMRDDVLKLILRKKKQLNSSPAPSR
ncbi:hypothetical protein Tsubulata_038306, partial [Turnera subulata]